MKIAPARVLVALSDSLARESVVDSLTRGGLEVVGAASDAAEVLEMARRTTPSVALIDVGLPGGAVPATKAIVGGVEGCRVIARCADADRGAVLRLLRAGAVGYVVEGASDDDLLAAVRRSAGAPAGLSVATMTRLLEDLLHELADRSAMLEQLRRSEERFRGLLESAPDAVIVVDREGEILLVNQQAELMFGYARSDMLGRPIEFLLPERFHMSHIGERLGYVSQPRPRRMGTVPGLVGRRMNGTEIPVDISLSTLEAEEGFLVIAFIRDASQRARGAEEAHALGSTDPPPSGSV